MSEWISVEDRVPNRMKQDVLVFTPSEDFEVMSRKHCCWDLIKYWMFLPEPPEPPNGR